MHPFGIIVNGVLLFYFRTTPKKLIVVEESNIINRSWFPYNIKYFLSQYITGVFSL